MDKRMPDVSPKVSIDAGAKPHDPGLYREEVVCEAVCDPDAITDNDVKTYYDQGFLVVASAIGDRLIAEAIDALHDLIALRVKGFSPLDLHVEADAAKRYGAMTVTEQRNAVRKVCQFVGHDRRMADLAAHPNLQGIAGRLLGGQAALIQDMALLKPPHHGREKPWHQDHAYFNYPLTTRVVGVWIALDPAHADNGCMHVLPGWHRRGPLVHFNRRDWQICDTTILGRTEGRCAAIPMAPGSALFFDSLLPHGTPTNASSHRRRALQFHYVRNDAVGWDQQKRLAIFGSEGKDVTC